MSILQNIKMCGIIVAVKKSEQLYHKIEQVLIAQGYITQHMSDIIARQGTRKEGLWKRHIIDLCDFVLQQKRVDVPTEELLTKAVKWCKT